MNEFDDFDDPQLRSTLQRAAGPAPDLHLALAAVSSRAKRIQRRRTVSVAATSLGLVVAAVAIVARPLDHDVKVTPGTDVNHVSTTVPVTTSPTTPAPRPSAPPATPAVTNPIATGVPGTSVDDHGAGSGRSGTSAGSNAAGNETQTYSSEGGSVTVRLQNGAVRIVAGPSAASGFQASVIDRGPDRVRVEFDTSGRRSRITVTAAGGHLVGQVSESGHGGGQGGGGQGGGGQGGGGSSGGGSSGGGSSGGGSSGGGSSGGGSSGGGSSGGGSSGGGSSSGGDGSGGGASGSGGSGGGDDPGSHGGHG